MNIVKNCDCFFLWNQCIVLISYTDASLNHQYIIVFYGPIGNLYASDLNLISCAIPILWYNFNYELFMGEVL